MCVVERKTYIHPDGRREVVEKHRRCHNAPRSGLCAYVEYKNVDVARIVEMRPSSSRELPSDGEIITTGRDGRPRRYQTVSRRNSARDSFGRSSRSGNRSPADSLSPSAPPVRPTYEEIRPPAPMPPSVPTTYPSARHSGPALPPDPHRSVGLDGTAVYERPPSLEMPRAENNERPNLQRPSSFSSTAADIVEPEMPPPGQRVSFRARRPSSVTVDIAAASANVGASGMRASPGLSSLPNPFAETIPREKGKSHARVDSGADYFRRQQEDERQASIERGRLAEVERRQQERLRNSREAAEEARRRAEDMERERAESSRERARRKARAALEGEQQARRDAEIQRKVDAELAQVAREKADADARKRDSAEQYQSIRPSPISARNSYTYPTSSPTLSARTMSPTTTLSVRQPSYQVTLHHYPPARKNSLSERGDAVIAREQARAATERMNEVMAGMDLEEALEEDDMDAAVDASMRRSGSRRLRKEAKDREREQRRERERRLRDQGYYRD